MVRLRYMELSFKPADTVQLKTGGPIMSISHQTPEGYVCLWFDKNDNLHQAVIRAAVLRKAVAPPSANKPTRDT